MQLSHNELVDLKSSFAKNVIEGIDSFMSQDLENPEYFYSTECLWKVDQEIGGIGGYCMPSDPTKNPFPAGEKRSLYRPLQYARSHMDLTDIRKFARPAIEMSGMHLEAVCRKYLQEKSVIGSLRFQNTTLGKAVERISRLNDFDLDFTDKLFEFVKIYNLSKHEINQDEARMRMFNAHDAVVSYFAVRILGANILRKTSCEEINNKYEIVPGMISQHTI